MPHFAAAQKVSGHNTNGRVQANGRVAVDCPISTKPFFGPYPTGCLDSGRISIDEDLNLGKIAFIDSCVVDLDTRPPTDIWSKRSFVYRTFIACRDITFVYSLFNRIKYI